MLKTLLYGSLGIVGIIAALCSPLAGGVAIISSYMMNPVVFSPELQTIRFQFVITAAFLIGLVLHQPRGAARVGSERFVLSALVLYTLLAIASSAWAVDPNHAFNKAINNVAKTTLVACLLPLIIPDPRAMRVIWLTFVIGAFHASFMHVVGGNLNYIPHRLTEEYGIVPDMQASIMVIALPVVLMFAIYSPNLKWRILSWISTILVVDSIVNTYQRAYFVALAAEAIGCLVFLPKRIAARLLPIGLLAAMLFLFVFTPTTYWTWMDTITEYENEASASSRIYLLMASLRMFADHPMGVGYDNYDFLSGHYLGGEWAGSQKSSHNTITKVACETGVIGITLYMMAFGGAWWLLRGIRLRANARDLRDYEVFAMGLEIGLLGWLVGGMFHADHEVDPAFWAVAFAVSITRIQYWEKHHETANAADGEEYEYDAPLEHVGV